MSIEKKLRSTVYGSGYVFMGNWSRHAARSVRRLKRVQKRGARAKIQRIERDDDA